MVGPDGGDTLPMYHGQAQEMANFRKGYIDSARGPCIVPNYWDRVFAIMKETSEAAEGSTEAPAKGKSTSDEVSAVSPNEDVSTIAKD